jgi:hypothetical protein
MRDVCQMLREENSEDVYIVSGIVAFTWSQWMA